MEWSCTELSAGDELESNDKVFECCITEYASVLWWGATEDFDTEEGPNQMHTLGREAQVNWKIWVCKLKIQNLDELLQP